MQSVVQTSPNAEQKSRIVKDIAQYKSKLERFFPEIDLSIQSLDSILSTLKQELPPQKAETASLNTDHSSSTSLEKTQGKLLSQLEIKKASPACQHMEVNVIFTVLERVEHIYWPILKECYLKMEYNYISRQNALQLKLENVLQNIKYFTDIVEDTLVKEQNGAAKAMRRIESHSTRKLLLESDAFFKDMYHFLTVLIDDIKIKEKMQGLAKKKIKDMQLSTKFLDPAFASWENNTLYEFISEFFQLCSELVEYLSFPDINSHKIRG